MSNSSKKTTLTLLTGLVLGAGGYWLWDVSQSTTPPVPAHLAERPVAAREETPAEVPPPVAEAVTDEVDVTQALEDLPDPDLSAESLIGFAHQLSGLMENAMNSEKDALPAFGELEQCALNTSGKEVIQARLICFANASKLSKEFPSSLGERFRRLAERNPKLVGLLQTTGIE